MTRQEDPSLALVIQKAIEERLSDLHTCMPGVVSKVFYDRKTVNVRPALKRKYINQVPIELPELTDVTIGFFQTHSSIMSFPIKEGDDVWVFFAERSLDVWKQTGGIVSPDDTRKHHLSDAVAIPVFKPISSGFPSDPKNILIRHNESRLTISPDGMIKLKNHPVAEDSEKNQTEVIESELVLHPTGLIELKNPAISAKMTPEGELTVVNQNTGQLSMGPSGKYRIEGQGEELLSILKDLITACESIITNTQIGPQPPVNKAAFTALISRITKMIQ